MEVWAINRTKVELKHGSTGWHYPFETAINRTKVELKL